MEQLIKKYGKYCIYALLIIVSIGCSRYSDPDFKYDRNYQYSAGEYKNFGQMLTRCDSITIVVAVGINEGNLKAARHLVTVVDNNGKAFTYAGGKLDLQKGDTVKWMGSN
jgi:hypothetical protein